MRRTTLAGLGEGQKVAVRRGRGSALAAPEAVEGPHQLVVQVRHRGRGVVEEPLFVLGDVLEDAKQLADRGRKEALGGEVSADRAELDAQVDLVPVGGRRGEEAL